MKAYRKIFGVLITKNCLAIMIISTLSGCADIQPLVMPIRTYSIPYEHLHPKLQLRLGERAGASFKACGNIVYVGSEIDDGPEDYYDNRTGDHLSDCNFWGCFSDNARCKRECPPKGWTCN